MTKADHVIAQAHPTAPRRFLGTAMFGVLGGMLLALANQSAPQSMPSALFLGLVGIGALVLSWRFWQATAAGLLLTPAGISDTTGRMVLSLDEIEALNRGTFAAKPATGFALVLRRPARPAWAPGLWWRMGQRLGVGGALSRAELRVMADRIEDLLKAR